MLLFDYLMYDGLDLYTNNTRQEKKAVWLLLISKV